MVNMFGSLRRRNELPNLEAKRLKRLAAKNKKNYDNDDDENDGGNDGFGIK